MQGGNKYNGYYSLSSACRIQALDMNLIINSTVFWIVDFAEEKFLHIQVKVSENR